MPKAYKHFHYEVVGSTNDLCKYKCISRLQPVLITADKQTDGRGRNKKKWESPEGNISLSYGFFCDKPHPALALLAAIKTTIAIDKVFGKSVKLKWPNDLIYRSKKIGGILIESENINDKFLIVIGIGINLKIKASESHWGDLDENLGNIEKKLSFINELVSQLEKLENFSKKNWISDWESICVHMQSKVKVPFSKEEFLFNGINKDGLALLVNSKGEITTIHESSINVIGLY